MSTTVPPAVEPSAVSAAGEAYERTRVLLFPFRFEHWLTLGLVAFLEQCGRGGVGGTLPGGPPGVGWPPAGMGNGRVGDVSDVGAWFTAHLALIVTVATCALALAVLLIALVV